MFQFNPRNGSSRARRIEFKLHRFFKKSKFIVSSPDTIHTVHLIKLKMCIKPQYKHI